MPTQAIKITSFSGKTLNFPFEVDEILYLSIDNAPVDVIDGIVSRTPTSATIYWFEDIPSKANIFAQVTPLGDQPEIPFHLVHKKDIARYRELSKNVRDDKINPYIDDAEFLDLRPLIGGNLYRAIKKNPAQYAELLNGNEDMPGGLIKVISIFAYSRYILFGSFTDTGFGYVEKMGQDSQPVSASSKKDIYTKERNTATQYWYEVERYLNASDIEVWKTRNNSCKPRSYSGLRISKITK